MRSLEDARRWSDHGTGLFTDTVEYHGDSILPGWTRKHLAAHIAANGEALGNLVRWAATGQPTPMYASPEARADGIAHGVTMTNVELDAWLRHSAAALHAAMSQLDDEQWKSEVVTAQGRTVAATEIPWMRAREVCVHAVDLGLGVIFSDLPVDFLEALCVDIIAKRGSVPDVEATLPERAAWLSGRPHHLKGVPDLGPWL